MSDAREQLQQALGSAYTLERELGGGGMSRVFLAREAALGREVVIKAIAPELLEGLSAERFAREVKLAARLQQANIVPVLSAGDAAGLPYYTMPFVRGESLRARLATGERMPVAEIAHILRDIARALAYAHGEGIVHRDIKPENILLSGGAAVVTDFGIAKALATSRTQDGSAGTSGTLTHVGTSLGTPAYMAPEQAAGDPGTDHRADIYAWGVVAWELLAGKHPFADKKTPHALVAAHIGEAPVAIGSVRADVPAALAHLVQRCLAKSPAERPASAKELLSALDQVTTPDAMNARTNATAPSSSRWRVAAIVGALAVVALVALGVGLVMRRNVPAAAAPPDRSIAVLPLANLSGDKADDYFGIGLAEEMTRALSKTGVRVIGRVSAGALQARGLDERAIARELGVGSLLTGSVQRAAGQVRINVSLVSATDGAVRWTEKYDRPIANVFAVQDEIANAVAGKLLGSLGGGVTRATRVETADPEAYALFLQGQVLLGRRTATTVRQAIDLFTRAAARDPKYARAHAMQAVALSVLPNYVNDVVTESVSGARAAVSRALALDSTTAEAWTALGQTAQRTFENRAADAYYRRAVALDSTVSTTWGWWGLVANRVGDPVEAHRRIARARALEPASMIARTWDAQVFLTERRYADAEWETRAILALDSTFSLAWDVRGEALSYLGRHAEAVAALERNTAAQRSDRPTHTEGILAFVLARAGRPAESRALIESMRRLSGGRVPAMAVLGCALDLLGDRERGLQVLADAIRESDAWLIQYNRAERFDRLRSDPRGAALLAKVESW